LWKEISVIPIVTVTRNIPNLPCKHLRHVGRCARQLASILKRLPRETRVQLRGLGAQIGARQRDVIVAARLGRLRNRSLKALFAKDQIKFARGIGHLNLQDRPELGVAIVRRSAREMHLSAMYFEIASALAL